VFTQGYWPFHHDKETLNQIKMILFRIIKNWFVLTYYSRKIKNIDGKCNINKKLLRKLKLRYIKVKVDHKLASLLITSEDYIKTIKNIHLIWVNNKVHPGLSDDGGIYQVMYDVFSSLNPESRKVTIVLDIKDERQIEKFRRILTLYGFYPDKSLTLQNLNFTTTWRDKEVVKDIVYSRIIS